MPIIKAIAGGDSARATRSPRSGSLRSSIRKNSRPTPRSTRRRPTASSRNLTVGYTELRAPFDGVVGNRSARVGAYAGVGSQLISVVPAHGLWVDANFKENQLAAISAGNR
ncbi:MAG: efflux RND transporter periplasmic adaptor subunit [Chthoniobacteraceae bacterium]